MIKKISQLVLMIFMATSFFYCVDEEEIPQPDINDASKLSDWAIASAGPDVVITLPTNTTLLDGSKSVDRDPNGTLKSFLWLKTAGPASFSITNPNSAITNVTNLVAGTYWFRMYVTNSKGNRSYDDVKITVVNDGTIPTLVAAPTSTSSGELYFAKDFTGVLLSGSGGQMQINNFGLNELLQCSSKLNFIASTNAVAPCRIEQDPAGTGRDVLYMQILDDDANHSGTSRAQLDISFDQSIINNDVIHMSHRQYLHPDVAHMVNIPNFHQTWFTLQEHWFQGASGENPAGGGRITLYIKEAVAGKLNLRAEMQRTPNSTQQTILWREDNLPYVIPFGKWFTIDTYYKRGEGANGQYKLTITVDGEQPVTVFDIRKTTFLPDAPSRRCNYFSPMKLYGGDGPLYDAMRNANKKIASWYNDFKWYKD